MRRSLLDIALRIARKKMASHPEFKNYIHYTFVVQGNRIVEWGVNRAMSPARHYGYHRRIKDIVFAPKIHSEIDAYRKARGVLNKGRPFEIINIRLNRSGHVRISKPCECCYAILKALGCRKFYYSDGDDFRCI